MTADFITAAAAAMDCILVFRNTCRFTSTAAVACVFSASSGDAGRLDLGSLTCCCTPAYICATAYPHPITKTMIYTGHTSSSRKYAHTAHIFSNLFRNHAYVRVPNLSRLFCARSTPCTRTYTTGPCRRYNGIPTISYVRDEMRACS